MKKCEVLAPAESRKSRDYLLFNLLINYEMILINTSPLKPAGTIYVTPSSLPPPSPAQGQALAALAGVHPDRQCFSRDPVLVAWYLLGPESHPDSGTGGTGYPSAQQSIGKCIRSRGFAL